VFHIIFGWFLPKSIGFSCQNTHSSPLLYNVFRYSMDTVTSLKTYNPSSNTWRGADRFRCIHARIPFSTEIISHFYRSYIKASAYRYKNFVDGSKLGVVWHSATKLYPQPENKSPVVEKNESLTDVSIHNARIHMYI